MKNICDYCAIAFAMVDSEKCPDCGVCSNLFHVVASSGESPFGSANTKFIIEVYRGNFWIRGRHPAG